MCQCINDVQFNANLFPGTVKEPLCSDGHDQNLHLRRGTPQETIPEPRSRPIMAAGDRKCRSIRVKQIAKYGICTGSERRSAFILGLC